MVIFLVRGINPTSTAVVSPGPERGLGQPHESKAARPVIQESSLAFSHLRRACHEFITPGRVRLARLSAPARQLVMTSAVLGSEASAKLLWQMAELGVSQGVEALEEAIKSGILREEENGASRPTSYRFTHDLVRDVVYTELGAARRLILHQRALTLLKTEGARVAELAYHALSAGEAEEAYRYSVQA